MSFSISGKTAIVTGAASGLGYTIARHLVEAGANVMFFDDDEAQLAKAIGDDIKDGGAIQMFAGDICKKLGVANLVSAAIDNFDRVDILVNAARKVETTDPYAPNDGSIKDLFDQNVMGPLRLSQYVAKRMRKQNADEDEKRGGAIVNVFSQVDRRSHPALLGYSLSTAALDQMTRSLAVAYAPENIRVNAVSFASVMSDSLALALRDDDELRENVISRTPLGRLAGPSEICGAVHYLVSEEASFVTGEVMTIDGGRNVFDTADVAAH